MPNHQANPQVHQQYVFFGNDVSVWAGNPDRNVIAKKHTAGERVDLLDDYDFPARTIIGIVLNKIGFKKLARPFLKHKKN